MNSVFRQYGVLLRSSSTSRCHRHLLLRCFVSTETNTSVLNDDAFFLRILSRFNDTRNKESNPLSFAYGSAVFQQHNHAGSTMTDIIFAVRDPVTWHRENMKRNPKDYALLAYRLGPEFVANLQDQWGARLYFNTLLPFERGLIKYGVLSRDALIKDLLDWENVYVSGRLHKPVKLMELSSDDADLNLALRMNLRSALHVALLTLPERFAEEELYLKLAGLSYTGDFRMIIGEDKNKVSNLVKPHLIRFRELYAKPLTSLADFIEKSSPCDGRTVFTQDSSPSGKHYHLTMLPWNLQSHLVHEWNRDGRKRDVEEVLRSAAFDPECGEIVQLALHQIIRRNSLTQALKGIFSAGLIKTIRYSSEKLWKMYRSMKR